MLDVSACELTVEDKELLDHPLVGGVILFSRNYHDQPQLGELVRQIREHARNRLLLAVDHEGGRVQRFRHDFSLIPAMGNLFERTAGDLEKAAEQAKTFAWLMAAELLAFDIDLSFAPVLDVCGISEVIGDRSFHQQPEIVIQLAASFIQGMHEAGMKATGKHFPGHGSVQEDSHVAMPVDRRPEQEIVNFDMRVFAEIHQQGLLDAVMPAHVIYPQVDKTPAGFSSVWIRQYLRNKLNFDGVVFSDDLSMQGAVQIGAPAERAKQALEAGCDMVVICNDAKAAAQVLDGLPINYQASDRLATLKKPAGKDWAESLAELTRSYQYKQARQVLDQFHAG